MKKREQFWKRYGKAIIQLGILLGACVLISCIFLGILFWTEVLSYVDGEFVFNSEYYEIFTNSWYGYLLFFITQIVFTTMLSFAPGGSMTFIIFGTAVFGANFNTFLLVFAGVVVSSVLMDFLGRFGGNKFLKRIFTEEDYAKATKLLEEKGTIYLPVMYLLPIFPDDAICAIAGMSKVKFWYHLLIIILCRGVGVATIVFGINIIPFETFKTPYDWILCITVIVFWVLTLVKGARYIDIKLTKYRKNKDVINKAEDDKDETIK